VSDYFSTVIIPRKGRLGAVSVPSPTNPVIRRSPLLLDWTIRIRNHHCKDERRFDNPLVFVPVLVWLLSLRFERRWGDPRNRLGSFFRNSSTLLRRHVFRVYRWGFETGLIRSYGEE
jgi:hypothetical protein